MDNFVDELSGLKQSDMQIDIRCQLHVLEEIRYNEWLGIATTSAFSEKKKYSAQFRDMRK